MTVTVAELKAHLNIDHDADDALLTRYLAAADDYCKKYVGTFGEVPDQAVLMLAAHFYENREAVSFGAAGAFLPFGVRELLDSGRAWWAF